MKTKYLLMLRLSLWAVQQYQSSFDSSLPERKEVSICEGKSPRPLHQVSFHVCPVDMSSPGPLGMLRACCFCAAWLLCSSSFLTRARGMFALFRFPSEPRAPSAAASAGWLGNWSPRYPQRVGLLPLIFLRLNRPLSFSCRCRVSRWRRFLFLRVGFTGWVAVILITVCLSGRGGFLQKLLQPTSLT